MIRIALISIVYRRSNRRFRSSSGLARKTNVVHTSRTVFHLVSCSRQLHILTSLAMAAPSAGPRLVAHNTETFSSLKNIQGRTELGTYSLGVGCLIVKARGAGGNFRSISNVDSPPGLDL
ncbi:hypothetical protein AVEN_27636-1 [Araneus ventricosus]|uniref:Uncharacterized protein n=1 Tax=Araneus ventricosus TaxID=182803 RepID=A0A4Y2ER29_ARAVE|nr:hypothetical protein AVEN_27636-1 [Araneus ventricosus]